MPGQERLKDRLTNKFDRFLHSLVPHRSRDPSHNRTITPTLDPQASSTPVGAPDPISIPGIPDAQPLISPSLWNTIMYPSIAIDPAGDEAPGRTADLTRTGFQDLKTTLQLIERATDVSPSLKSTATGLLGIIDIMEVRDFQLSVPIVMMLTVPRQPLRTNEIAEIWSRR